MPDTSPLPERPAWSTQTRPEITLCYGFRLGGVKIQPASGDQFCTGGDTGAIAVRHGLVWDREKRCEDPVS